MQPDNAGTFWDDLKKTEAAQQPLEARQTCYTIQSA